MEIKIKFLRQILTLFIGLGILFIWVPKASAHDFWIEQSGQELILIFGHGDQREDFDLSRVKTVKAFSQEGREVNLHQKKKGKGVLLQLAESPAWILAEIDNGYWSKTIYGWKNLPKRKASRVVEANRSLCYAKAILLWNETLQQPAAAAILEIAALENPFALKEGDWLPICVYFRGRPLSGADIEGRQHEPLATSDKKGNAKIRLSRGQQFLAVSYKEPVQDDPDADYISYASTLTFEVKK